MSAAVFFALLVSFPGRWRCSWYLDGLPSMSTILLMHHWRPCLKLRSAILIVLSTVVAKDANHQWWKKRDRIGGNREAFSSLETLGCVQRSLGCSHGDVWTEFGDEKTCFSPSAASAGRFPRMVRDIQVVARTLAPLGASPLDAPGSIILEDLESVSTTLFCCSCMDCSFRLLFAFVSMCRSRQAQFFLQVYRNSLYKRNWHLFRPRPQLFAFCLHFDTHFYTSVTAPCSAEVHKATVHICMQKPRSQSSWLRLPLRSLCCAIHPLSRLHGALLRKQRNSILLASSNFILLHPGMQHHRVTPPMSGLRLRPWL